MDRLIAIVALRWRIELRTLARARERALGLLLIVPGILVAGALGFVLFFFGVRMLGATRPHLVLPLLSVAATGIGVFWALSPLLAGVAFTESHDVSRLLHFPVGLPTLAASSLVANLFQPMVLLKLPVLAGVALGVTAHWGRAPFAFLGVAVTFVFMLAASQAAGLALHAVSRSRRLQDVALFLGLGLGFVVSLAPLAVMAAGGRVVDALARLVTHGDLFAVSPFAWGVRAAVHAGRGEPLPFVIDVALGLAATGLAMAVSALLIDRIHRGALDLGAAPGGPEARARMVLRGPLGALLEKDLRVNWRDPALKAALLMGLVTPLLFLFLLSRGSSSTARPVMLLASLVGLSTFGANPFGFERRGVQLLMGFPVPRWKILVAKNLGAILFRVPGLLTLVLACVLLGSAVLLPAVIVIALVTLLVAAGLDNYMAVLFPVAAPAPGQSPYGGGMAGGRGLGAAALGSLLLVGSFVAALPFTVLAWLPLAFGAWLWLLTLPLALAGAAAVYAMLVAGAARLLERREPDLLQRILEEA